MLKNKNYLYKKIDCHQIARTPQNKIVDIFSYIIKVKTSVKNQRTEPRKKLIELIFVDKVRDKPITINVAFAAKCIIDQAEQNLRSDL